MGSRRVLAGSRPGLESSSRPPAPTVACSQLPCLKLLTVWTQAEILLPSASQWETVGLQGVLMFPIVNDGLGWGQARQGLGLTRYSEPNQQPSMVACCVVSGH